MIFDNIKNCKMYYGLNPKFEKAFDFIKKVATENTEVGKYEIDGKDIYAMVQSYQSKLEENCKFEGHENYIDIQYIVKGHEMMGTVDISRATVKTPYNPEKDVTFYENSDLASYCQAQDGDFCIFYPHDIHRPGMACENIQSDVKKVVVKIHI